MIPPSINNFSFSLEKLTETRDKLNAIKNANQGKSNSRPRPIPKFGTGRANNSRRGGSVRMQKERVDLPSAEQDQNPLEFRSKILEAMKGQHPKKYERFISEYYRELVK